MLNPIELIQMNKRFDGFWNTSFLWSGFLEDLEMFDLSIYPITDYPLIDSKPHIRLGKLIEQFVLYELVNMSSIRLLESNKQVFKNQITIGELDCLIKRTEEYIHLEVVYKFYLYDPRIEGELNRWTGPNRNDSLVQKLEKLKHKQLPLLYHPETTKYLDKLKLTATDFKQQVYFKAQLFVPYDLLNSLLPIINNDCINGFYIRYWELDQFSCHTFFIPEKLDWIIEPHLNVNWLSNSTFQDEVTLFLKDKKSPLCWMKPPDGKIQVIFIVWWE